MKESFTPPPSIGPGDLVQVVRMTHGCGSQPMWLGRIVGVEYIDPMNPVCSVCRSQIEPGQRSAAVRVNDGTLAGLPLNWLKRIPPLSELEGTKTEEDIREPA